MWPGPSSLVLGSARLNSLQLWPRVDNVFSVLPQHPMGALFLPDGLTAGYPLPELGLLFDLCCLGNTNFRKIPSGASHRRCALAFL